MITMAAFCLVPPAGAETYPQPGKTLLDAPVLAPDLSQIYAPEDLARLRAIFAATGATNNFLSLPEQMAAHNAFDVCPGDGKSRFADVFTRQLALYHDPLQDIMISTYDPPFTSEEISVIFTLGDNGPYFVDGKDTAHLPPGTAALLENPSVKRYVDGLPAALNAEMADMAPIIYASLAISCQVPQK